jgi:transcriptional regulator with XRE-family HTH domain
MPRNNRLSESPPFAVEDVLSRLGTRLKTARLRRRFTIEQVAERIGTGVRAVRQAEGGKPTTAAVVYFSLLWLYDLLDSVDGVANPLQDTEGLRLASLSEPERGRAQRRVIDNDF